VYLSPRRINSPNVRTLVWFLSCACTHV
jgi:hypothetical protein